MVGQSDNKPPEQSGAGEADRGGSGRKPFLVRLPPDLLLELRRWAEADLRSLNSHIEYLLREAVRRRGR